MSERPRGWVRALPWIAATVFYSAFAIYQTWPLVKQLTEVLPHDLGDPMLNAWIIWWNAHVTPFTQRWWNPPAFWPSSGVLAFSEVLLGLTPITTPVQWMGGSAVTAYNVAFLVTFPLSALAAHALAFRLTGRHDAGVIAGLVFGFNPFRVAHVPQIQVLTSYWMPIALLSLHAYMERGTVRWLVLFAFAWLMQAVSNGYYLLFFPVLLGVWTLFFGLSRGNLKRFWAIACAFAIGSLPLIPLLWTYRRIHNAFAFQRDLGVISGFGADVVSLLDASPLMKFWSLTKYHQPEGELFPGLTAAILVLILVLHWAWTFDRSTRMSRAGVVLLVGALVATGVALSAVIVGPWAVTIGGTTLMTVRVISKPLSIGVILFVAGMALLPSVTRAWRRRSPLMFYALATAFMYLLAFGPQPRFLGTPFMYRGPYNLLTSLPGYDAIRVPARFAMLAILCLSMLAAFAFARVTARAKPLVRILLTVIVVCGVIADSAVGEMPLKTLPMQFASLDPRSSGAAVMELPLGDLLDDAAAMYRGIFHGHPVVNGYSGFFPREYDILRRALESRDPKIFDAMTFWGPVMVLVDPMRDAEGAWAKQLANRGSTEALRDVSGWRAFLLWQADPPLEPDENRRLRIDGVTANVNPHWAPLMIDGDAETRWHGSNQTGLEEVAIDLGKTRTVDALTMTIGTHVTDYPRRLVIDSSDDGQKWTERWSGTTAAAALVGAVRHPHETPVTLTLPHVSTRWLRLRQLGQDRVYYWSIFELAVYGT